MCCSVGMVVLEWEVGVCGGGAAARQLSASLLDRASSTGLAPFGPTHPIEGRRSWADGDKLNCTRNKQEL